MFNKGRTIYHVERIIKETGDFVDNGFHEIYLNTKNDDNSDIAELMKIFKSADIPKNDKFPNICKTIRYYKKERGSAGMCKAVEEYAKEYAKEARAEAEQNVVTVILELRKGTSEEELLERGFSLGTINNAKIAIM